MLKLWPKCSFFLLAPAAGFFREFLHHMKVVGHQLNFWHSSQTLKVFDD